MNNIETANWFIGIKRLLRAGQQAGSGLLLTDKFQDLQSWKTGYFFEFGELNDMLKNCKIEEK